MISAVLRLSNVVLDLDPANAGARSLSERIARVTKTFPRYENALRRATQVAQVRLAWRYRTGIGLSANADEFVRWSAKAADAGNASGIYLLGLASLHGEGADVDPVRAFGWFAKAARKATPLRWFDWPVHTLMDQVSHAIRSSPVSGPLKPPRPDTLGVGCNSVFRQ